MCRKKAKKRCLFHDDLLSVLCQTPLQATAGKDWLLLGSGIRGRKQKEQEKALVLSVTAPKIPK
jgi:hypothetical protein